MLALRYGDAGFTRFDVACLALAGLGGVGWALSGSAMVALWMNLLVDLFGALPTMRKAYRDPSSESALTWRVFFTGNALNLFAIQHWTLESAAYPLYVVIVSGIVNVLLVARVREPLGSFRPSRASGRRSRTSCVARRIP